MKPFVHINKEKKRIKLHCKNASIWPPPEAFIRESLVALRKNGELSDERYEAHNVWVRKCSKTKMDSVCTRCPLSEIKARVRVRATGRYTMRKIGYIEHLTVTPANIFVEFEKD